MMAANNNAYHGALIHSLSAADLPPASAVGCRTLACIRFPYTPGHAISLPPRMWACI